MNNDLFASNTPDRFWRCLPDFEPEQWDLAIKRSISTLGVEDIDAPFEQIIADTLGEGRFGEKHWDLGAGLRFYYYLKPLFPKWLIRQIRKKLTSILTSGLGENWMIEDRYVRFLWDVIHNTLEISKVDSVPMIHFWPRGNRFAFVLTHDVESQKGVEFVKEVAVLEQEFGFRSSFNFVPEKYPIDEDLIAELIESGFEIGIHGLRHDGNLFKNYQTFSQRARQINSYLSEYKAGGFRSPLTHRHPSWMQELQIDYDLSFFDNDPFEPIPGGTMSIWPFRIGHFIELPYTLFQDHTLVHVLGERSPDLWLKKVDFIEEHFGMVLLNTHPDYLRQPSVLDVYRDFLAAMKGKTGYWHALPKEIARWWAARSDTREINCPEAYMTEISLERDGIVFDPNVRKRYDP